MLHWIILSQYTSICGAIHQTLYSHHREVETLTREDRDIMDGSTFFVVYYCASPLKRLIQSMNENKEQNVDCWARIFNIAVSLSKRAN